MTWGLQTYKANGALIFDTATHVGLLYLETVIVPAANGTYTYSYPAWTGRTLVAYAFSLVLLWSSAQVSVSYPGGVPTLTVVRAASSSQAMPVYLFIR